MFFLLYKYDGFVEHQKWLEQTKFEPKGLNAGGVIIELYFEKEE